MKAFQTAIEAMIEDVNKEDGSFVTFAERMTDFLFVAIKWGCTPFLILLIFAFLRSF